MMRRIFARLRLVAPPGSVIASAVAGFLFFSAPQLVFRQQAADPLNSPGRRFLVIVSILLGIYRAVVFHPYFRRNYLRWLKSTPWAVTKPLPLGPVELIPEDGLAIGLIMLLSTSQPQPRCIELLEIFLLSHMAAVVITFWRTEATGFGYMAIFLLGFVPLLWTRPWLNLLMITVLYLFVHEGLWRALRRFPWETEGLLVDLRLVQVAEKNPPCGWFFDRFHRDIKMAKGLSRIDALLGCMLGSWWLFVVGSLIPGASDRMIFLTLVLLIATMSGALVRILIYAQGYRAPISVLGRIATFRSVIPGYDQILVGPICALLVGITMFILRRNSQIPAEIFLSIGAGLTVLVTLISPPSLKHWRLTGQHRLAPTFAESQAASANKMGQS